MKTDNEDRRNLYAIVIPATDDVWWFEESELASLKNKEPK